MHESKEGRETKAYKAIVYARVSTEDQAENGYSLEGQTEEGIAKAEGLGYHRQEILVLTDDVSGGLIDRPGLNRLRALVGSAAKPEIIIMHDPDRFARKLTFQLLITEEIIKNGVQLEFINFEWKNTAEGRMFYQLRGMFAEFEREKIRERTMRGRLTKMKNHGKLSCDPRLYGYRFDRVNDVLVLDPNTHKIVQFIYEQCIQGQSGEAIARHLAERRIPAPRGNRWHGSTVTRILHNQSYLGIFMAYKVDFHQGYKRNRPPEEQFPLSIEPIIDQRTFDAAQSALEKNRIHRGRPPIRDYLLSGKSLCYCGKSISAHVTSGNKKHTYYTCNGKRKISYDSRTGKSTGRCQSPYWNSQVVDDAVWAMLCHELLRLKIGTGRISFIDGKHLKSRDSMLELNILKERSERLKKQRNKLLELFISEGVNRETYDAKRKELQFELDYLQEQMAEMEQRKAIAASESSETNRNFDAGQIRKALDSLNFDKKLKIVNLLVDHVLFNANREMIVTLNIAYDSVKLSDSEGNGGL